MFFFPVRRVGCDRADNVGGDEALKQHYATVSHLLRDARCDVFVCHCVPSAAQRLFLSCVRSGHYRRLLILQNLDAVAHWRTQNEIVGFSPHLHLQTFFPTDPPSFVPNQWSFRKFPISCILFSKCQFVCTKCHTVMCVVSCNQKNNCTHSDL